MSSGQEAAATRHGSVAAAVGTFGGVAAVVVSVVLAASLPLRGVDYNALNLFTIVLATAAGLLAIRGSHRDDGAGLGWGLGLLLIAVAPAVFGWVILLYLPALMAVVIAVVALLTKRSAPS